MGLLDGLLGLFGIQPKMSDEEIALRNAIGRDPDNDAPRLAYAQWLEQKKDPRGEFIRISCERAKLDPYDPQAVALDQRESELLDKYGRKWCRPLKELELEPISYGDYYAFLWFERGMIEKVTVDKRDAIPGKITRLFELAPVARQLVFERCSPDWTAIGDCQLMSRIRGLDLSHDKLKITANDLRKLLSSPHLSNLTYLDLGQREFDLELIEALEKSSLKKLKTLKLSFSRLSSEAITRLAKWPGLSQVEVLDLSYNSTGKEGIAALLASPVSQSLVDLNLHSCDLEAEYMAAFAKAKLPKLKKLNLESNDMELAGLQHLLASGLLPQLVELNLEINRLGDAGAELLAKNPGLAGLKKFELSSNNITAQGAKILFASPHLKQVVDFKFNNNEIGNEGIQALIDSKAFPALQKLGAFGMEVKDDSLKRKLEAAYPKADVSA